MEPYMKISFLLSCTHGLVFGSAKAEQMTGVTLNMSALFIETCIYLYLFIITISFKVS